MATDFLIQRYRSEEFYIGIERASQEAMETVKNSVIGKLESQDIQHGRKRLNINEYIKRNQSRIQHEQNQRSNKIQQAAKEAKILEGKLNQVNKKIKELTVEAPHPDTANAPKRSIHAVFNEIAYDDQKRVDAQKFLKEVKKNKKQWEAKKSAIERSERERLEEELKREKKLREQQEQDARVAKTKAIGDKLTMQKERRNKEVIDYMNHEKEYQQKRKKFYAYQRYQAEYAQNYILPEIKRQREEISKKKEMMAQVTASEIAQHSKSYDNFRREREKRRERERVAAQLDAEMNKLLSSQSKHTTSFLERDRALQELRYQESEEKFKLKHKRDRYARMVKEIYVPEVSREKQLEMQIMREKSRARLISHRATGSKSFQAMPRQNLSEERSTAQSMPFRPRKFKPNPLAPKPKTKPNEPKVSDYLADRRNARKEGDRSLFSFRRKSD